MRIGLTGASGMLGQAVIESCNSKCFEVFPLSRDLLRHEKLPIIVDLLESFDAIIHAAANTNVEECETNPYDCYKDNTLLTELIAFAASESKTKMIYISSTGIYGDYQKTPYCEYDDVRPTTHHHRSKWLGENAVLKMNGSLVVRTGWLFGGALSNKKNFVARRVEEALQAKRVVYSNNEQLGNPTYVNDVSEFILRLIEDNRFGVFNCVNEGFASRMEYVKKIVEYAGINIAVEPADASKFNRKANVSKNEMAVNFKASQCGLELMPHWADRLRFYVRQKLGTLA